MGLLDLIHDFVWWLFPEPIMVPIYLVLIAATLAAYLLYEIHFWRHYR